MKRISTYILAAAMVLSGIGAAHAIDIKVKGAWDFAFGWAERTKFADSNRLSKRGERDDDNFIAAQRIRTQINFIASENLQGVLMFEIGDINWGRGGSSGRGSGGQLDADGVNIETKRAYLDWMIPDTDVAIRMGIQNLALPMATAYSSPVFNADVAGIVTSYKIDDTFAITAFWVRPFDQFGNDGQSVLGNNRHLDDEMDLFGLTLPISLDSMTITPWGMWGRVGSASGYYEYMKDTENFGLASADDYSENEAATAWWAGLAYSLDITDGLTFAIDGMYGRLQKQELYKDGTEWGSNGWFITATLNYDIENLGTAGLFGWWASGDSQKKHNAGVSGRIPLVGTDDGFGPTSFGTAGAYSIGSDSLLTGTGAGTWGVGIQLADMSFIEDLRHTIRVAYIQGTNDHKLVQNGVHEDLMLDYDGVYMTTKDSAIEVNFDHTYQIYENLTAVLELGYINLDLDTKTWRNTDSGHKTDDAWKAQVMLNYSF